MTLNNVIAFVLSAGFLTGIGALLKAWWDHKRGTKGQEIDAEDRLITRLEKRIETLESRITHLEGAREADHEYIFMLLSHISEGKPPPPPARRKSTASDG